MRLTGSVLSGLIRPVPSRLAQLLGLAALALPAIAGFGCKKFAASGPTDAGDYTVVHVRDGGDVRVHLGPGPIPAEFPPGLPLCPGAQFESISRTGKDVVLMLVTRDPPDAALAFYRRQPGYEVTFDSEIEGMRVLNVTHPGSGKKFQVLAEVEGRATRVSLVAPLTSP